MPLLACGSNGNAQLSLHHQEDTCTLQRVLFHPCYTPHPRSEIIDLTSSSAHSLLLLNDPDVGRVLLGCGTNTVGQLGPRCQLWSDVEPTDRFKPISISGVGVDGWEPVHITSTWSTSFVVFRPPTDSYRIGGSNASEADEHTHDRVIAFGSNDFVELGSAVEETGKISVSRPSHDGFICVPIDFQPGERVTLIKGGQRHVCLVIDGARGQRIVGWGACRKGQLDPTSVPSSSSDRSSTTGLSLSNASYTPHDDLHIQPPTVNKGKSPIFKGKTTLRRSSSPPITLPLWLDQHHRIVDIALGASHTVVLLSDGSVRGWGANLKGQITDIDTLHSIVSIATTWNGTYFLQGDGKILSQGSNTHGQLLRDTIASRGEVQYSSQLAPHMSGEVDKVGKIQMVAGSEHLLVVIEKDTSTYLWTGGWNEHGNLCLGHAEDQSALQLVSLDARVRRVWGGLAATWAWVDDGQW